MPKPTDEQVEIMDAVRKANGHLMINSLAGTGKTTTLKMIDEVSPANPKLYVAFNRRNVDEAENDRKRAARGEDVTCFKDTTVVRSFNSLGHRVWMKTVTGRVTVDTKKTSNHLRLA